MFRRCRQSLNYSLTPRIFLVDFLGQVSDQLSCLHQRSSKNQERRARSKRGKYTKCGWKLFRARNVVGLPRTGRGNALEVFVEWWIGKGKKDWATGPTFQERWTAHLSWERERQTDRQQKTHIPLKHPCLYSALDSRCYRWQAKDNWSGWEKNV